MEQMDYAVALGLGPGHGSIQMDSRTPLEEPPTSRTHAGTQPYLDSRLSPYLQEPSRTFHAKCLITWNIFPIADIFDT